MDTNTFLHYVRQVIDHHASWQSQWESFESDETLGLDKSEFDGVLKSFFERLEENYPFFHPAYVGQMVKSPHPVAMLGYLAAQLINPNNHALEGGPATARMEKNCVEAYAKLFGFEKPLGHLTGGGTLANLEALWVSRQLHPDKAIGVCENAHYTHSRWTKILNIPTVTIPMTDKGRMDLEALEDLLKSESIGTLVATLGTTALGAVDPLHKLIDLKSTYGFRIHVDGAYGGHFATLANHPEYQDRLKAFKLISKADSIVVDPHKHGLQPYGCGCILYNDASVGRFYAHESPYTYFSSPELHLGEISLECSRPGAAAAGLWLTLQCFPLEESRGFGPILQKTLQAARQFAESLRQSTHFHLYVEPDLDIVTYFPKASSTQDISNATMALYRAAMEEESPLYLVTVKVPSYTLAKQHHDIVINSEHTTLLRSCLMKPEHLDFSTTLVPQLEAIYTSLPDESLSIGLST